MKKIILIITMFSVLLAACSNEKDQSAANKNQITVYTTVFPLQYFTEQIGGKYVNVKTIYPPGADEHTFEPSQKDMMHLADSDLFFYIGLGLEGFVEKAKNTLKDEHVTMIATASHLNLPKDSSSEDDDGHHHEDINPHVWLDPIYCKDMAAVIHDSLVKQLPKQKTIFDQNYEKLTQQLDQLNQDFEQTVGSTSHKEIIVTHAAFGYWEKRYGLKQISISGLSTSNEPTQKELEKIISTAEGEGIHYILFEQNVKSKLGKIIQKEIGAKALPVHNLAILTEKDIHNNETYFTLMEKNLKTLKTALNP